MKEFAANGYHATSTTAIAKRAGISQPYIYALFPNKRELFLAVDRHVVERIRSAFVEAARGQATTEDRLEAMGHAYIDLLARPRRDPLPDAGPRRGRRPRAGRARSAATSSGLWEDVKRLSGASDEQVVDFMAKGMLLNVVGVARAARASSSRRRRRSGSDAASLFFARE